jgi:hypothetical protein
MRYVGRVATAAVLALLGTGMISGGAAAASSSSYPPITGPVQAVPPPCTKATSIPPVPAAQVPAIEKKLIAFVGNHIYGIGQCGHGLLVLTLSPGSEALAQRVRAKFGPSVQIMVGLTAWNGRLGRSPTCGTLAQPTAATAGYSSALDLRSRRITVGGNLAGHVALRNRTATNVSVGPGGGPGGGPPHTYFTPFVPIQIVR